MMADGGRQNLAGASAPRVEVVGYARAFTRFVFAAYLVVLLWLVLFKFSADPLAVIANYQARSLNLIPFAGSGLSDMRDNFLAFFVLGLLLGNQRPVTQASSASSRS
jgi:glycopeptide antibiotics resistance protein